MATKIQVRRDTTTNWSSANPILSIGEIGLDTDLKKLKIGDGTTSWNSLSFLSSSFSDPMTTRGDIIVRDSSNTTARLPIGTSGQVLQSNGTDIIWGTPTSSGVYITTTNPTVSSYPTTTTKDMWFNSTTQILYILTDPTVGANVWTEVIGATAFSNENPFGDNSQKLFYEFNNNALDTDLKFSGDTIYNGTATNVTYGDDGEPYAIFNGTNSKVASSVGLGLTFPMTLSFYIKCGANTTKGLIEGFINSYGLHFNGSGHLVLAQSTSATKVTGWDTASLVNNNVWHKIVMQVDNITTASLWVDNNLITPSTASASIGQNATVLSIGYSAFNNTLYFTGNLKKIRVFNRGLTQTERESL